MATTKKGSKNKKKTQLRRAVLKTSAAKQAQIILELRQQLAESLQRESKTAIENVRILEQQTATSEILRAIARLPAGLQPVLDTVAVNAARVCGVRGYLACGRQFTYACSSSWFYSTRSSLAVTDRSRPDILGQASRSFHYQDVHMRGGRI